MSGKRKREVSGTLSVFTNYISEENSITSKASASFSGVFVYCSQYAVAAISVFPVAIGGTITVEGSFDGNSAVATLINAAPVTADTLYFKRIALKYPYIRVEWLATSGSPVTTIYTVLEKQGLTPDDVELPIVGSSEINAGTGIAVTEAPPGVFEITNTAPDLPVTITAGTGISAVGPYPDFTVTNTAPDLPVTITAGTGISAVGPYPDFTVTNTAPDLPVQLNSADASVTVTGGYPIFDLEVNGGTATDVTLSSAGTGATLVSDSAGPLISTKALNAGTGISITGTATNDLVLTNTDPASGVTLASAGGVYSLVNDGVGKDLVVKGLTSGSNVTIADSGTALTINSSGGGFGARIYGFIQMEDNTSFGRSFNFLQDFDELIPVSATYYTSLTSDFSNTTNARLQYTSAVTRVFRIFAFYSSDNTDGYAIAIAKNGVVDTNTHSYFKSCQYAQVETAMSLAQNDVVSIYALRMTGPSTKNVFSMSMSVVALT